MATKAKKGRPSGSPQQAEDRIELDANEAGEKQAEGAEPDIEPGIGNDSGTIPGRKVDHSDPHDIPPPGMKRRY